MGHEARSRKATSGVLGGRASAAAGDPDGASKRVSQADPREKYSRRALQTLFESADETMVLMAPDGTIDAINEAGACSVGKSVDEIIGRPVLDVLPPRAAKKRMAKVKQAVRTLRPVRFEDEREGRWFENTLYPLLDEEDRVASVVAFARETTDRRLLEKEREAAIDELEHLAVESGQQSSFYARLLDSIPIDIAYLTTDLVYREVNKAAARSMGKAKRDVIGQSIEQVRAKGAREMARAAREIIATGRSIKSTVHFRSVAGRDEWREVAYLPDIDGSGQVRGLVAQALDVTELMEARTRAEQSTRELAAANYELKSSNKELVTVMQHAAARIAYFDPDFNLVTANGPYISGSGYTRAELIGQNHFDRFPDPDNRALFEEARRTGRAVHRKAHPFVSPSQPWIGTTYWDWALTPVKDAGGEITGFVFSQVDVTETIRSKQLTETLADIEAEVSVMLDPGQVLDHVLREGARAIGCETGMVALRDEGKWLATYLYNMPSSCAGNSLTSAEAPHVAIAAKAKRLLIVNDTASDARPEIRALASRGLGSFAVVPIVMDGKTEGLILFNCESGARPFSEAQVEFLTKLGSLISLAMDNARLQSQVRDELARTQVLQDVAIAATVGPDLQSTGKTILEALTKRLDMAAGDIRVLDRGAKKLTLVAARGYSRAALEAMKELPVSRAWPLAKRVIEEEKLLTHEDDKPTAARASVLAKLSMQEARYLVGPIDYQGEVVGLYSAFFDGRRRFSDGELELLHSIGHVIGQAIGNATLFESQVRAQWRAAEELAISNTLLDASERLAAAKDTGAALSALTVAVGGVSNKSRVSVVFVESAGRQVKIAAAQGRKRPRPGLEFPMDSVPATVRTGLSSRTSTVAAIQTSRLSSRQRDWVKRFAVRRILFVPLVAGDELLGHICLDEPGKADTFTPREIRLAEGIAAQAAQVLQNARLHEQSLTKARNLATVSQMGTLITSNLSLAETSNQILDYSALLLKTQSSMLLLLDHDSDEFRVVASEGITSRVARATLTLQQIATLGLGVPEPVVIEDISSVASIPFFALDAKDGYRSAVVAAMFIDSQLEGLLIIQSRTQMTPSTEDVGAFRLFTNQVATAIRNARQFEEQRRIAEVLQQGLVKPVGDLPMVDFGIVYRSALEAERVGGDFYDAFELEDDRIAVLIGDVSGKGITAAGLTETIKSSVRTLAYIDPSPAFVFSRLNQSLLRQLEPSMFATASLLVVDLHTGELTVANAGHPPPILCERKSAHMIKVPAGQLLGAFATSYRESYRMLEPGQTIVLYTDGITEARGGGKMFGDRRLMRTASALRTRSPQEIADGVIDAAANFAHGGLKDDVVVLAVRLKSLSRAKRRRARDKEIATRAPSI